ncbi:MAG: PilC/PilY family type IV pilus protein, partial [Betaproteobacteria bacterium]
NWPVWPTLLTTNDWQFNDARSIDDFWHAAVNGRGRLFSAKDPDSLVFGIKGALSGAESTSGAGAGAVSATVTAAASGNEIFTTGFTTSKWTGDVQSRTFTAAGINDNVAPRWSAQEKLVARVADECDLRNIRLIRVGDSENNNLAPFTWDTQACDPSTGLPTGVSHTSLSAAEQTLFGESVTNSLSQFETGGTATQAQRAAAGGAALVNFLRGQRGRAGYIAGDVGHLFRTRESVGVLGDIVNSQLAYVGAPSLEYTDADYDSFKTEQAARKPMAYVGANDGMLHAFYAPKDPSTDAKAGKEAWAVIPTPVLPNLYRLADVAYGSHHAFFVDGSPTTGDVCISEGTACSWKTILVGGLDSGGKGYYALDITNPDDPKALWEFKASSSGSDCATSASAAVGQSVDCNLGLSYGRPVITKLANGTWVVLVASGYNNNSGAGDGQGYLYVLNAGTGKIIRRIGTGAGDSTTPSGLRELTTYMSNPAQNNQATRVYGGDLLGNLWRFDINDASASAVRITTLTASNGTPTNGTASSFTAQPITTRINLVEINGNTFLLVGTGRMLGKSDFTDTQQQSVYSIKDPLTTPTGSDAAIDPTKLRAGLRHVVLSKSGSVLAKNLKRTATCTGSTAECASTGGWYLDLTEPGERVSIDMGLAFGTLAFQSNVPDSSACSNGTNLFNYIDFVSGKSVYDNGLVTELGGSALAVGSSLISFGPGPGVCPLVQMVTNADGSVKGTCVPLGPVPTLGRRVSWREIVN